MISIVPMSMIVMLGNHGLVVKEDLHSELFLSGGGVLFSVSSLECGPLLNQDILEGEGRGSGGQDILEGEGRGGGGQSQCSNQQQLHDWGLKCLKGGRTY